MSTEINNDGGQLVHYLQTACAGGCSWGEVDEFVRARFAPSDIAALLAANSNVTSLEELFAEMGVGVAEPRTVQEGSIMTLTPDQKGVLLKLIQEGQAEMAIDRCVAMCEDNLAASLLEQCGYGILQLAEHPLDMPRIRFVREGEQSPVYAAKIADEVVRRNVLAKPLDITS